MNCSILFRFAILGLLGLGTAHSLPNDGNPAAGPIPAPADGKAAPDRKVVPPDANRVLRPNDLIRVEVADEPDLSCDSRIRKNGEATLPLVGWVKIAGLSVKAAAAKIRDLYAKDYLNDPKVTLSIRANAPEFVSAVGEVKIPGHIPIPKGGKLDLATAMAACGGVTEKADPARIQVRRAFGAIETYDMASIKGGAAGRVELDADDRIIVKQSSR